VKALINKYFFFVTACLRGANIFLYALLSKMPSLCLFQGRLLTALCRNTRMYQNYLNLGCMGTGGGSELFRTSQFSPHGHCAIPIRVGSEYGAS
jgi:hypothetical protein